MSAEIPSHRPDLTREVDLIEELIRLRGYDEVPATLPRIRAAPEPRAETGTQIRASRHRSS